MPELPRTSDGTPIGGWVLRGDRRSFDVGPMLEAYGQVYRHPVPPGARADLMDAGQPCFLYRTDTSGVVGLWAIGEVVAPVLVVPLDPAVPDGPHEVHAEVEMLPLRKPIAGRVLRELPELVRSELFADPAGPNPLVLEPRAVRAIEALEFELVPPTAEQAARLDALLTAEEGAGP